MIQMPLVTIEKVFVDPLGVELIEPMLRMEIRQGDERATFWIDAKFFGQFCTQVRQMMQWKDVARS